MFLSNSPREAITVNTKERLNALRGRAARQPHNARTLAALTNNPGCHRRAVLDTAGVDKQRLAAHVGHPMPFGQSIFAITRGKAFESAVKAQGCARLLRLLRAELGMAIDEIAYEDLALVGADDRDNVRDNVVRHTRTRQLLAHAARGEGDAGTFIDHPLLRLRIGSEWVYLEPDLIALRWAGTFHIIEIKSFPVIDGQADGEKLRAAAIQSAVYVYALRQLLAELGFPEETVSHDAVLVCPRNFSNQPSVSYLDVRTQLRALDRQLRRLTRMDQILTELPDWLTFDLRPDPTGVPRRPSDELRQALDMVEARYSSSCLSHCELAHYCRAQEVGSTSVLGTQAREDLGGIEQIATVLELARGTADPAPDQAEAARLLRMAERLRAQILATTTL